MAELEDIQYEIKLIEKEINDKERLNSESEGSIKTYMKQLKDMYDISSEDEMHEFIKECSEELKRLEKKIEKLYMEIKDEYNKANEY